MSIDEHVGREQILSETALSRDGGTRYYILHPKDNPETIISSCEVTAKKVFIAVPGIGRAVQPENAYGIASVFTNPLYRGKGMAAYLLKRVQEVVDDGETGCECGALYSDIGREYYAKLGWKDYGTPQMVFEILEGRDAPGYEVSEEGVELLTAAEEEEIERLCNADVESLKRRFHVYAILAATGKRYVAFLPDWKQISWHFARDEYVVRVMAGKEVVNRGARTKDGGSWILWDHDLKENKLKILRLVLEEDGEETKLHEDARQLLLAALREAADWGLKYVAVWEPWLNVGTAAMSIWGWDENMDSQTDLKVRLTFEQRDGSIPSLRWKGGEIKEETRWQDNEYYAWC
ncbi:hypothetical protein QBC44DRAFT_322562 [Cladorrhinum sp. PSN332]|nr:hypothetical protein QBC44DRAFT_322562 [Cladorrhinum sp. PSN332]